MNVLDVAAALDSPTAVAPFCQTSEAAKLIGVSEGTIRFWERSGRLPALKMHNGVRLFPLDTVNALAAKRGRAVTTPDPAAHVPQHAGA